MAPKKNAKTSKKKESAVILRTSRSFDEAIEGPEIIQRSRISVHEDEIDEPVQDTGLARYSNSMAFDPSDLFIPRLRLAQGLTAEVQSGIAKPGEWLVLGADPMKSPTVIPLLMVKRRELRDTDDNRAVLCRSSDSITGIGNPGGECAKCPMDKWTAPKGKKANAKNTAPPCTFIYSYIVFIVETEELCVLEFYRTSIPTGKMLNTMVLQKGFGKFAIKLQAKGQTGPRGTYYQPSVQPAKVKEATFKIAQAKASEMF